MVHYCTSTDINTTHIGMPYTTGADDFFLSKSVADVVDNFGLEADILGITSDGGGNLRFCREALEFKYSNDSVFHHKDPLLRIDEA